MKSEPTGGTSYFWAIVTFATLANGMGLMAAKNQEVVAANGVDPTVFVLSILEWVTTILYMFNVNSFVIVLQVQIITALLYYMVHKTPSKLQEYGALVFIVVRVASFFMLKDATDFVRDDLRVARAAGDERDWGSIENQRRRQTI